MFAQESNGTEYDINDPRNPNCPCHKYQKAADEEYQRELNKQKVYVQIASAGSSTVNVIDASADIVNREKEINEHNEIEEKEIENKGELKTEISTKHKVKRKRVKVSKHKSPRKKKFKFGKKDNSRCTHW
jgi:hypothetical protein